MFLHLTNVPLKEISARGPVSMSPLFYGKPIGLWYAPNFEWARRLDRIGEWAITASDRATRGPYTFTLEYYEKVFGKVDIPTYTPGDVLKRFPQPQLPHYAYMFPLADTFATTPALDRIFNLKKSTVPMFLDGFEVYYKEALKKEVRRVQNKFWERIRAKGDILHEPEIAEVEAYLRSQGLNPAIHSKGVNAYLPFLIQGFLIDELLRLGMSEEEVRSIGTIRSWGSEMVQAVLKQGAGKFQFPIGFKVKTGLFTRILLTEMGHYFEDVLRGIWGGIQFDASLFDGSLDKELPMLKWVEVPSGCMWHPDRVMVGYTPKPVASLAVASTQAEASKFTDPGMFVAGQTTDNRLVLFQTGVFVGGRKTRVQTLRRTTRRLSKNGHRLARQSKHGRYRRT